MEQKINLVELLKDCLGGMELDCTMFDDVYFDYIDDVSDIINCYIQNSNHKIGISFNKYGHYSSCDKAKCVIFPKGKTTWEGFHRPFKDGDVLADSSCIFIVQKLGDNNTAAKTYCALHNDCYFEDSSILDFNIDSTKLATEEEKAKLFKAIEGNGYRWNPETKTLEKLSPNFREYSDNEPLDIPTMTTEFVKEHGLPCPNGYVFKDDNGNEILTDKIILEKKKKEYPKTYEECLSVLGIYNGIPDVEIYNAKPSECKLFETLIHLKRCRDAYWKIAGEELGLDGPWEPDWRDGEQKKYCIHNEMDIIRKGSWHFCNATLAFPTEEMRDAFYENFKEEIEECKELL